MPIRVRKYSRGPIMWLIIALLSLPTLGESKKSEPKKIDKVNTNTQMIDTKESLVDIQGKKFRKIEIRKEAFFVETLDSTQTNSELRVLCQQGDHEVLPAQVQAGIQTVRRTSLVIEGMRQACKEASNGRREISIDPAVLVGLQFNLDQVQNKRILVTPIGVTFKADW